MRVASASAAGPPSQPHFREHNPEGWVHKPACWGEGAWHRKNDAALATEQLFRRQSLSLGGARVRDADGQLQSLGQRVANAEHFLSSCSLKKKLRLLKAFPSGTAARAAEHAALL